MYTILVVEDEDISALSLQTTLRKMGFDVPYTARAADEAFRQIEELNPDLVLMNINIAGPMGGIEAADYIRKHFGIPIVFLTAYDDDETLQRAKLTEPYGYVIKPISERELRIVTEIAIHKSHAVELLRTHARQQEVVAELGHRAVSSGSLSAFMDEACRALAETLGVEYARVLELLPDGSALSVRAAAGWPHDGAGDAVAPISLESHEGFTLSRNEPIVVHDLRSETRFTPEACLLEMGITSSMTVVIHGQDVPFGVVGIHTTTAREFTGDDVHFLQAVSNLIGAVVERIRSDAALAERNAQLERRVDEHVKQLETANRELESFSYSVSHDLRAPLRRLDGFSQALLEDYADVLDERGAGYLERIRSSSQRMGSLIDDLLILARISRTQMSRHPVDLCEIAHAIVKELKDSSPERQAEFIIPDSIIVKADAGLLRIAMHNLLGNAWKYSYNRPIAHIEVGIQPSSDPTTYFIRDNGAGFDMVYAGKLFGAFQRLHSPKDFDGAGIGLATVQRIIHRHGGRIWAEAAVDKGATFYFTLG